MALESECSDVGDGDGFGRANRGRWTEFEVLFEITRLAKHNKMSKWITRVDICLDDHCTSQRASTVICVQKHKMNRHIYWINLRQTSASDSDRVGMTLHLSCFTTQSLITQWPPDLL